jgi:transposase
MAPRWRVRVMDSLSQKVYEMVVWPDHFLRQVDREVDFTFVNDICAPYYHNGTRKGGRPAEEPERIFRALLVMVLYGIPFETTLVRQIGVNLAFRWFTRLGIVERVFDHSLFYVVRDRLGVEVFEAILAGIFEQCLEQGLIGHEWAFYDCTDIAATGTRYTLYERAVILARAVLRLLERPPAEQGKGVLYPPSPPSPALRRMVAEMAKEVVKAKKSKVKNILKGIEKLEKAEQETPARLPHRERVARALAEEADTLHTTGAETIRSALVRLKKKMPHAKGDADARVGHTSRNQVFCGYLSGNLIDDRYKVIGATHLEPGNVFQPHGLMESGVVPQYKERAGRPPDKVALDGAFGYPDITLYLAEECPETEVFVEPSSIPPPRPKQQQVFAIEHFTLTQDDRLLCPNQELDLAEREMRIISHRQDGTDEYAGQRCADCVLRAQCTTKAKGPRTVRLHPARHRHRMAIQAKAQTIEHRAAMRQRMASIEPIFGHGKVYHHWAKAPYRSLEMNRIFNLLLVIAHDVEKLVRYAPVERHHRLLACSPATVSCERNK